MKLILMNDLHNVSCRLDQKLLFGSVVYVLTAITVETQGKFISLALMIILLGNFVIKLSAFFKAFILKHKVSFC